MRLLLCSLLLATSLALGACQRAAAPSSLLLLTDLSGALESCPCDASSPGGLERWTAAAKAAGLGRATTALVVGGNTFFAADANRRPGLLPQQALRAAAIGEFLQRAQPVAILPGPADLAPAAASLPALAMARRLPMVWHGATQSTFTLGGIRMAVVGLEPQADWEILRRRAQAVRAQGAQLVVALLADSDAFFASAPPEAFADLPEVNVVVQAGLAPGADANARVMGTTLLVAAGARATALGQLQLQPGRQRDRWRPGDIGDGGQNGAGSFTFVLRPIVDAGADPWVKDLQARTNQGLCKTLSTSAAAPPARQPDERHLGSRACVACHAAVLPVTEKSPHARAWQSVQQRGKSCDVSCAACHSTAFQQPGGNAALPELGAFAHVGCEACHGPGAGHVAAPTDRTRWGRMSRTVADATCRSCHTPETSPGFDIAAARAKVLGPGHAAAGQGLPAIHHVDIASPILKKTL